MSFLLNPHIMAIAGGGISFDYTNLLWRVRAADIVGKSDGDSLNAVSWLDTYSGSNRNWTFTSCLYQTNEINGHPAVDFRGQSTGLDFVTGPDLSGLGLTEIDIFCVVKAHADPASGAAQGIWTLNAADYANAHSQYPDTGGTIRMTAFLPSGQARMSVNATPALDAWRLLRVTAKTGSNNYTLDLDGTNVQAETKASLTFPVAPILGKASDNGGTAYYFGLVAEWFAFSTKCDATQAGTIRDYVNSYYGLSVA